MHHLSEVEQQQFLELFNRIAARLSDTFSAECDTSVAPSLRYVHCALFPIDKTMSRATVCTHVAVALEGVEVKRSRSRPRPGVYARDLFTVGDISVVVCVSRRGGRMIGFQHVSDT